MTKMRGLIAVTLGLLALAAAGSPAHAQDNGSAGDTVGAPALRTFSLPGTRTTAPAEAQAPQPNATAPPPAAQAPAATPAESQPRPAPVRAQPSAPAASAPTIAAPIAAPVAEPEAPAFDPSLFEPAPAEAAPLAPTLPTVASETALWQRGGLWAALGAALILSLALVAFARSRRTEPVPEPLARAAVPAPAPRPAAPIAPLANAARPQLEMEFTAERVVATATEVTVHYALAVRNAGKGAARRLRAEAQIFNASAEQRTQIGAFFATPGQPGKAGAMAIAPGQAIQLRASALLRRDQVREVVVQGRPLFIPTVAISLVYEYGDARIGQSSASYVVGVESQASAKMGPFRLDLGPRIYRSVGQRRLELARTL